MNAFSSDLPFKVNTTSPYPWKIPPLTLLTGWWNLPLLCNARHVETAVLHTYLAHFKIWTLHTAFWPIITYSMNCQWCPSERPLGKTMCTEGVYMDLRVFFKAFLPWITLRFFSRGLSLEKTVHSLRGQILELPKEILCYVILLYSCLTERRQMS